MDPADALEEIELPERRVLLLAHFSREPYIARRCRRRRARRLASLGLFTIEPIDRGAAEPWLQCTITPLGHDVAKLVVAEMKAIAQANRPGS